METKKGDKISSLLRQLLEKGGFDDFSLKTEESEEEKIIKVFLDIEPSGIFIGKDGSHLKFLEHLLRVMAVKIVDPSWKIFLDINNYQSLKERQLRELAQKMIRRVSLTKQMIELEPMTGRERRIIHLEVSLNPGVITESIGEGRERRVVIKPVEINNQ